ncbi:MAG: 3-deoxy-8-phosphooctulonate synthase [Candidatus Latescibacterota bacterium]
MTPLFHIQNIPVGGGSPLFLVAGPCVLESEELANRVCSRAKGIAAGLGIGYIFKSSYDKANRQSYNSYRGPGIERGLEILNNIRAHHNVPVLTDVHSPEEAEYAGKVVDVLQIPAFLCRQTDLAFACGAAGKPVFIKKGQFMAPEDMASIARKVEEGGSKKIVIVERGTTFGYHDLVVDIRSFPVMQALGFPVVFDCTHSVQRPGGGKDRSGGDPQFIETLARAAAGAGVDGVFIETHPDCSKALCDASTMLPLDKLEKLMKKLVEIDAVVKG